MNAPNPDINDNDEDKPLDPATEKVRKKLVKFSAIFMGINMLALMAVLVAIVYKISGSGGEEAAAVSSAPVEPGFERFIDVPDGTQIVSASRNGNEVSMVLRLSGGKQAIWFVDIASGNVTGKLAVE